MFVAPFAASSAIGITRFLTKPAMIGLGDGKGVARLRHVSVMCALILLSASSSRVAYAADLSAAEILNKVSDTYTNLKSCRFIAMTSSEADPSGGGRSHGGSPGTDGIVTPGFYNFGAIRVEVSAVTPNRIRVAYGSRTHVLILMSDGPTTWACWPQAKEYKESPGGISEAADPFQLAQYWHMLVDRYRKVSQFASSATRENDAWVEVGHHKIECYVVKVPSPVAEDELWVDMNRFLVLRCFEQIPFSQFAGAHADTTITVNMVEADLNTNMDDSLFKFTPAKGWRRVSRLRLH